MSRLLASLALVAGLPIPECSAIDDGSAAREEKPFSIVVRVNDEVGRPVPEVAISVGKSVNATTAANGSVTLKLSGTDGESVAVNVKCPERYASPDKPLAVTLRRLGSNSPVPQFDAVCTSRMHTTLVGVRTENGQGVAIVHRGKLLARTDEAGTAHFSLTLPPNETVVLDLDTKENAALRPQSPSLTFRTSDRDELVLLEQKFTLFRKKVIVKKVERPKPL